MKARLASKLPKRPKAVPSDKHCNGKRRSGGLCKKPAGWGTEHLGIGRCRRHGGALTKRKIIHGFYSQIQHHRLKETLERLSEMEINAMDLIPEANMLRVLTVDYINRYEEFSDALMAWYNDPGNKARPRRIMDIQDAAHLIESISRVVQRMHQIQSEGAISLETFKRVTEQMGVSVARHVSDPLVLNRIEQEWMNLALDTKAPPHTSTDNNASGDK